jgi:hypothetical protein
MTKHIGKKIQSHPLLFSLYYFFFAYLIIIIFAVLVIDLRAFHILGALFHRAMSLSVGILSQCIAM